MLTFLIILTGTFVVASLQAWTEEQPQQDIVLKVLCGMAICLVLYGALQNLSGPFESARHFAASSLWALVKSCFFHFIAFAIGAIAGAALSVVAHGFSEETPSSNFR